MKSILKKLPPISKDALIIAYKLLHDALLLLLASFAAMLVAEGALPGMISRHISLFRITILIFIVLGAIVWIGKKFQITYAEPAIKKNKLLPVLILLAFLLIGNSLLKFAFWENMLITLATLFSLFLFYQIIFDQEK